VRALPTLDGDAAHHKAVTPGVEGHDAATAGDKLRRVLSEQPIVVGDATLEVTASVGAAAWDGSIDVRRL
jgi:hypothetical protein